MRCVYCHAPETKVIDSRLAVEGDQVRRRRECDHCQERFTTYEVAELQLPRIVKRDGAREAFNEDKLRNGMLRALEKRPISMPDVEAAIMRIKHHLQATVEKEIPSNELGEWVMSELKKLDKVAYVRFASVYRSFEDVNAFREVLDKLDNDSIR